MNVKFSIDIVVDDELKKFVSWLLTDFDAQKESVEKLMLLKKPIDSIAHKMTARVYNALMAHGITQVGDILKHTESEFLKYKNFGRSSLIELIRLIEEMGLKFSTTTNIH
jgi:DNA-directed RNA polymerase subunit alpha